MAQEQSNPVPHPPAPPLTPYSKPEQPATPLPAEVTIPEGSEATVTSEPSHTETTVESPGVTIKPNS